MLRASWRFLRFFPAKAHRQFGSRLGRWDRRLTAGGGQNMNHFARIPIKLRAVAPRFILAAIACWAVALLYAGRSEAQIRTPLGVYAHVDVPAAIQADITGPNANHNLQGVSIGPCSALPSTAASTVHTDLRKLYAGLLQSAKTSPPTDPVSYGTRALHAVPHGRLYRLGLHVGYGPTTAASRSPTAVASSSRSSCPIRFM